MTTLDLLSKDQLADIVDSLCRELSVTLQYLDHRIDPNHDEDGPIVRATVQYPEYRTFTALNLDPLPLQKFTVECDAVVHESRTFEVFAASPEEAIHFAENRTTPDIIESEESTFVETLEENNWRATTDTP